ncbi:mucin-2 [Toxorhynchites rutilus septentrionalis]|uniref:mucin-2 n=1 Tax=Toxorhynchites rutilus septentrionalis TaxID=329112 RepID=UPI002479DE3A|nr:mucin-2 [Toxorhynchites rutilus septentrionalis]
MWPMKLDMTRDECRGVLRRLELESYSSVISTFRAQGTLCKEKSRILEELRKLLHISQDRHKAEARRVANDERLTTVAEIISGPNTYQDWCREGRRTFPILPRTTPYTALTYIANTVCEQICRENSKLPHPFETSQNRLEKEQEENKKTIQDQQKEQQEQQQQPAAQSQPALKLEAESDTAPDTIKPNHPPVVTVDPFVEAAKKSYINNDLKRSYPIDRDYYNNESSAIDDESPLRKKPQLYQELQKHEPQNQNVTFHQHLHPFQFPAQQPLSPHKNLSSPNNFSSMTSANNSNLNTKTTQGKNSNRNTERQRKSSVSSKRNQNKSKTPYQSNKQTSGAAKTPKNVIPQQQLSDPIPVSAKGSGSGRSNNVHSPHLIHSYASPLIPYEIPIPMPIGPEMSNEQLQKHISSNTIYSQGQQAYSTSHTKSQQQYSFHPQGQQIQNINPTYQHQHQILPSSKKDIQYNLTKLNPINSMSMKNNVNIPLKQSSSSLIHGKGHPLLNYQKRSPSKNVLIPTSSAAAALASLGISKPIQRKDSPIGRYRDSEPIVNSADIPNPKIIFSTAAPSPQHQSEGVVQQPARNQITILDQITLHPPNTIIEAPSVIGEPQAVGSQVAISASNLPSTPTTPTATPLNVVAPLKPSTTASVASTANKVVTIKGPSLAGFTPVKGGSKLSVHKLQLVPISQPGNKNNVIVLPAKTTSAGKIGGTLNPGQKISIPKSSVISSVVDPSIISVSANAVSPPKVIVQQQPDLNNVIVFDYNSEQKLKTTSGILGSKSQYPPSSRSAITEDTPVDIVSNPLDAIAGAVKLQELSKRFVSPGSPAGSTASPLTEKMVKPQTSAHTTGTIVTPKYNSNSNINIAKATKFEADSTAPVPAVTVTKKSKTNLQAKPASVTVAPLSVTVQNNKTKSKTMAAATSSTTVGSDTSARTPAMGSTDWEHELDQANQATNSKANNFIPKVALNTASQSNVAAAALSKPVKPVIGGNSSSCINIKKVSQPLSSSSISSTSSNASSPVADQPVSSVRIAPHRPGIPLPITTKPTTQRVLPLSLPLVTTPPNERSDDTSATDSADAEEDPEVGDEDDNIEEEMIIDDEQHFHAVIEEDPELDETFNEQEIHGERVEIVNVGYDTSRALIADLEDTENVASLGMQNRTPAYGKTGNGVEINPSSMNFEQYIEETDCEGGDANGGDHTSTPRTSAATNNRKEMMFEMLEIDNEGNKHARTVSYEEALAEGQIDAAAPTIAGRNAGGGFSGSGVGKSKTKTAS